MGQCSCSRATSGLDLVTMMSLKLNILMFLAIVLLGFCSSNDEFSRARRIPYHMPGFWYHFLPKPSEDSKRYYIKRSWQPDTDAAESLEAEVLGERDEYSITPDGTLFGWDRKKKLNL